MAKPKPPRKTTLTDAQHAALLTKAPPPEETEEQFNQRMKRYEKGGSLAAGAGKASIKRHAKGSAYAAEKIAEKVKGKQEAKQ